MRLLEHESKRILEKYRISLPVGRLVGPGEPLTIDGPVMLKAQIPIGGRGKAGGILTATDAESERVMAQKLSIPIIGFIAGRFVDDMPGVRFGHAATIVEESRGSTKSKIEMFRKAGIHVAESFSGIVDIAKRYL